MEIFLIGVGSMMAVKPDMFTELAHLADSVIESQCLSVCLSVCHVAKHPIPEVVETSSQIVYS